MTHINIDDFIERLLQRAEAEQNVANRLYEAKASKESYMKANVTASVLRELAATFEQMSEDKEVVGIHRGQPVFKESGNISDDPMAIDYVKRFINAFADDEDLTTIQNLVLGAENYLENAPDLTDYQKEVAERESRLRHQVRIIEQQNGGGSMKVMDAVDEMKKILKM